MILAIFIFFLQSPLHAASVLRVEAVCGALSYLGGESFPLGEKVFFHNLKPVEKMGFVQNLWRFRFRVRIQTDLKSYVGILLTDPQSDDYFVHLGSNEDEKIGLAEIESVEILGVSMHTYRRNLLSQRQWSVWNEVHQFFALTPWGVSGKTIALDYNPIHRVFDALQGQRFEIVTRGRLINGKLVSNTFRGVTSMTFRGPSRVYIYDDFYKKVETVNFSDISFFFII